MSRSIFEGIGAAKEVLQNFKPICTTAPELGELHGVLELGCLAKKLVGVGGVQLQSRVKQTLTQTIKFTP